MASPFFADLLQETVFHTSQVIFETRSSHNAYWKERKIKRNCKRRCNHLSLMHFSDAKLNSKQAREPPSRSLLTVIKVSERWF